jgi:hypothetical protein
MIQLLKYKDRFYVAQEVQDEVHRLTGLLLHRIIDTSLKPESVIMRSQTLKEEKIRAEIWAQAIRSLEEAGHGRSLEEVKKEMPSGQFVVTDLEKEAKKPLAKPEKSN